MPKFQYAVCDDAFLDFRSQHIRVRAAKSGWEKQGYFRLRRKIFSHEQKILTDNEVDKNDFSAIPIVALASSWSIGDEVAGAVRIYRRANEDRIWYGGRLCVERRYRGHQRIGSALVNEAVSTAIDLGCDAFYATVQPQNESYFQSMHWHSLKDVEVAGRRHIYMQASLDHYPFMSRSVQ